MMKRRVVVAIASALLAGCDAQYREVSVEPEHKRLLAQICEVAAQLRAHGVALHLERDKKTDYISIWNPGFTGPELTFVVVLAPGTKLQVLAARECINCPFDRMLEFRVKVTPEPEEFAGKPAFIRAASLAAPLVRCPARSTAPSAPRGSLLSPAINTAA